MWKASLHTRHFAFEAYADSELAARSRLVRGLAAHGRQYDIAKGWYLQHLPDVETQELVSGTCYRDREPITPLTEKT